MIACKWEAVFLDGFYNLKKLTPQSDPLPEVESPINYSENLMSRIVETWRESTIRIVAPCVYNQTNARFLIGNSSEAKYFCTVR